MAQAPAEGHRAPKRPVDRRLGTGVVAITIGLGIVFPLVGISIVVLVLLDLGGRVSDPAAGASVSG